MEGPAQILAATEVKSRGDPYRRPFRIYLGLAYLTFGISLLLFVGR